jgi:hypothetical protein
MRNFAALALMTLLVPIALHAADLAIPPAYPSVAQAASDAHATRSWKISLIPLVASQGLDTSSSWGMRELNPVLADRDGAFSGKAAAVKFGAVGAFIGIEYLVIRKYPRSARVFAKMNWAGAILTTGFAVHNYAIR